ncbi:MAG: hypothetical protein ACPIOQ_56645, partial [Promethearchaeia archaeon]
IGGRLEATVTAQARIPDCSRFLSSEHLASKHINSQPALLTRAVLLHSHTEGSQQLVRGDVPSVRRHAEPAGFQSSFLCWRWPRSH